MTSQTVQAPPVKLKERIAAFQQRNASSHQRQLSISPSASPTSHSLGLRDKIAKFEQKGGVPVPRGSFGLGAPPVVAQSRKTNELYGNRIPSVLRSVSAPLSRSGSPLPSGSFTPTTGRGRSPFEDDDPTTLEHSPSSSPLSGFPSPGSSPEAISPSYSRLSLTTAHTSESSPLHSPTSPPQSSFTRALDIARRAANASDTVGSHPPPEISVCKLPSPVPVLRLSQPVLPGKEEVHSADLPTKSSSYAKNDLFGDVQECATENPLGSCPATHVEMEPPFIPAQSLTGCMQETSAPENLLEAPTQPTQPVPHEVSERVQMATDLVLTDASKAIHTSFDLPAALDDGDMTHAVEVREQLSDEERAKDTTMIHEEVPIHSVANDVTVPEECRTVFSDGRRMQSHVIATRQISDVVCDEEADPLHPEIHINASVADTKEVNEPEQSASSSPVSTSMELLQEAPSVSQTVIIDISHAADNLSSSKDTPAAPIVITPLTVNSPMVKFSFESDEHSVIFRDTVADVKEPEVPFDKISLLPEEPGFQFIYDQIPFKDEPSNASVETASWSSEGCSDVMDVSLSLDGTDLDTTSNGRLQEIKTSDVSVAVDTFPQVHSSSLSDRAEDPTFPEKDVFVLVGAPPQVPKSPISDYVEDPTITDISIVDVAIPQALNALLRDPAEGPAVLETPPGSTSPHSRPLLTESPNTSHDSFPNPESHDYAPTISTTSLDDAKPATPPTLRAAVRPLPIPVPDYGATGPLKPGSPESESEFGTVSKYTYSFPSSQPSCYAEPDFASNLAESDSAPLSFSAVVHRKVTEIPPSVSTLDYRRQPITPQTPRIRRPAIVNVVPPQSPGQGELAVLLKDAALLEKRLLEGDIPSDRSGAARQLRVTMGSEALDKTYLHKTSAIPKSADHRSRPIFHRALSSPSALKTLPRSRSADYAPEKRSSDSRRPLVGEHPSPDETCANVNETPSDTKSFRRRYFSSFRRLANASGTIPGIFPRKSFSTSSDFSSEDSTSVATPPDNANPNFAGTSQYPSSVSAIGPLLGAGLSSLSLSKSAGLSRAGSFAERIWKRGRTKSFANIIDTSAATHPEASEIPPLLVISSSSDATAAPDAQPDRPTSYGSAGSTSSSSPLDNELFDAFPSVPQSPTPYNGRYNTGRQPPFVPPDDEDTPTPTQNQMFLPRDSKPSNRITKMPIGPRSASKQTGHARLEP